VPSQATLQNILHVRSRALGHPSLSKTKINDLANAWKSTLSTQPLAEELVPARIVTILEVFVRDWVEQLVDHGSSFFERAAKLKLDLTFDYNLVSNLRGVL
jgi:hypothetical protein